MNNLRQSFIGRNTWRYSERGFSLIELMIALAIIAILAAIALPAYQDSMRKGRRAEAQAALMDSAARQEQYFLDNKTYSTTMTALGFSANPMTTEKGHYQIEVVDPDTTPACPITTCFQMNAEPQGSQESDSSCVLISLSSLGVKSPTVCW